MTRGGSAAGGVLMLVALSWLYFDPQGFQEFAVRAIDQLLDIAERVAPTVAERLVDIVEAVFEGAEDGRDRSHGPSRIGPPDPTPGGGTRA